MSASVHSPGAPTAKTAGMPFITSNLITVAQGAAIPFSSQLIAPPFRMPYLIKEIRFLSQMTGAGTAAQKFQQVYLTKGHALLTAAFMPVGMLCPVVQRATDGGSFNVALIGGAAAQSMLRWVLPRPMYCRAGEGIEASAQNVFTPSSVSLSMEISIVGEVLPPGAPVPKTSCVPFAMAYSTAGATPAAATSGYALRNIWTDKTLHMQRFIGRGYALSNSKWVDAADSGYTVGTSAPIVTLVDSEARTSILPPMGVYFGEAFDDRTKCLEHRRPLPPKGWFQASFQNIPATATYWLSMIGHREEAIS